MKKPLFVFALLLTFFTTASSQCSMDLLLYNKVKINPDKNIDVLIQGNMDVIKQLVSVAGGSFKYCNGDVASVNLPMNQIGEVISHKGIERIETCSNTIRPLNDTMLKNNNVLPVHNGQAPLTQGYDGTGIIIGFIDTGIDFTHPDFKDNLGHSRIKYLWDQSLPNAANTPVPYGYGQEFSNIDIDNGLAGASTDILYLGHGTHTAGIAVGNGLATGQYKGVAPNADIMMVAVSFGAPHNIIVDAANYIFTKAAALGKPCVINASLGDGVGSHDGKDAQALSINNMISTQQGRAFVAAAGNNGDWPYHLGYTVTSDTNFTLFKDYNGNGYLYINMYGEVANLDVATKFSIGADQITPTHSFRGRTSFSNVASHLGTYTYDTVFNSGHRIGIVQMHSSTYAGPIGTAYRMEFYIVPDSTDYDWRLIATNSTTTGNKFDVYNYDLVWDAIPSAATMQDSIYYKMNDLNQTIMTSFQCLDNVITVGGYVNRRTFLDFDGVISDDFANVGQLLSYSSAGPTRDGRLKPDINAPGDFLVSDVPLSLISSYYIPQGETYQVSADSMHVSSSGTSASAPSVAGIAALYLQKNPTATSLQVKNAITACATHDQFTGTNLPNNSWGYGKANAFTTLTGCSSVGISNSFSSNGQSLFIYPNPSKGGNTVHIDISGYNKNEKTELNIYNIVGEIIKSVSVSNGAVELTNQLIPGIYFCDLMVNDKKITTKKMVVFN